MSRRSLSQFENSSVLLIVGICSVYATEPLLSTRGQPDEKHHAADDVVAGEFQEKRGGGELRKTLRDGGQCKALRGDLAMCRPAASAAFARDHHYRLRCLSNKSRMGLVQCVR